MAGGVARGPELDDRSRAFLSQNYDILAEKLQNRVVKSAETGDEIMLTKLAPWSRAQVGSSFPQMRNWYLGMRNMQEGDWVSMRVPVRRMRQSLIVALDQGELGACVRVLRASKYDKERGVFVPLPTEGAIANFFNLNDNERAHLRFLNPDSSSLYLQRSGLAVEPFKAPAKKLGPDQATSELDKLLQ
jgi:hypothetical protein